MAYRDLGRYKKSYSFYRAVPVLQATDGDITSVIAGTGLTGGGITGDVTLTINDSVVATISGTTFIGVTNHNAGLSGSLTKLTDGSSYLVAGNNVTISSSSNGSVTISVAEGGYPGGSENDIQYNGGGVFAGSSNFTFNGTDVFLTGTFSQGDQTKTVGQYSHAAGLYTIASGSGQVVFGKYNKRGNTNSIFVIGNGSGDLNSQRDDIFLVNSGSILIGSATLASDTFFYVGTKGSANSSLFAGNVQVSGTLRSTLGISGSLTKLTNGTSYLIAGPGISIVTGSNGSVTITNDGTVGDITAVTAGNGLSGGGTSGAVSLTINNSIVATVSGTTFTGVTIHNAGLSGSLTRLSNGSSYLIAGAGISITTGSNGAVTITNDGTVGDITAVTAGNGLSGGGTSGAVTLNINDSVVATVSGTTFTGVTRHNAGLSGSLTQLTNGSSYLIAGSNVTITTGSTGAVTIAAPNLAPSTSAFLTLGNDSTLSAERAFTPGTGLTGTDGGANNSYTLAINNSVVATVSGTTFTGVTVHNAGLSGSLTKLSNGSSYLIAGAGISITTGSNGAVTITNDGTVGDIIAVTAGTGLTGGGTSGAVTLNINDSVVATVSGTTFTGVTKHNAGLSGSLTQLTNGSSYLIAGSNVTVTTGSTGAVTIAAPNLAPSTSAFLTLGNDSTLSAERALTPGTGLMGTDGGANSSYTLAINNSIVATVSGTTFTGATIHNAGLSGSLTQLTNGSSYLIAGSNVTVTTGSTGAVTISAPNLAPSTEAFLTLGNATGLSAERAFTAGTGLTGTDGGANSSYTLAINNSVVATVSGTTFTGVTRHNAGLSGSLTQLTNGSSYLIAGSNVTITTGSTGAVTIASIPTSPSTSVQVNNTGVFSGSGNFTYNGSQIYLTGSFSQGTNAKATGLSSHAEGINTEAIGNYSHAEGWLTDTNGQYSHAEGRNTNASGLASHAEGYLTIASGDYSHAEGDTCESQGNYSHAEGDTTYAVGTYSHAAGLFTIASGSGQNVVGKYNKRNNIDSLFIVGNGTGGSNALRSDVFLVNPDSVMVGSASINSSVFFFVSGTKGATAANSNYAIFGGDTVVSGTLRTDTIRGLGIDTTGGVDIIGSDSKYYDLYADWIKTTRIDPDTVPLSIRASILTLSGSSYVEIDSSNFYVSGKSRGLLGNSTTSYGRMPLVITSSYSNRAPASTGIDSQVASITIPANTLANSGDTLRCSFELDTAANANNKTVIINFGATEVLRELNAMSDDRVIIDLRIVKSGTNTQAIRGVLYEGTTHKTIKSSPTETDTSNILLTVEINNATATTDMRLISYRVVYEPNI